MSDGLIAGSAPRKHLGRTVGVPLAAVISARDGLLQGPVSVAAARNKFLGWPLGGCVGAMPAASEGLPRPQMGALQLEPLACRRAS